MQINPEKTKAEPQNSTGAPGERISLSQSTENGGVLDVYLVLKLLDRGKRSEDVSKAPWRYGLNRRTRVFRRRMQTQRGMQRQPRLRSRFPGFIVFYKKPCRLS